MIANSKHSRQYGQPVLALISNMYNAEVAPMPPAPVSTFLIFRAFLYRPASFFVASTLFPFFSSASAFFRKSLGSN